MLAIATAFGTANPRCTNSCRSTATHPRQSSASPSNSGLLNCARPKHPTTTSRHWSAPSISLRVQNCELATTLSSMIPGPSHSSHTADLVPCWPPAIFHATDLRFTPPASYRFSPSRSSNTSELHYEELLFTMTAQSIKTHVANWKYSSTKHPCRCCGIRLGTSGNTCWALRSASRRPSFRAASITTAPAHGIWLNGRPHFRAASKSHCPLTLLNRSPMLVGPITASVNLPMHLI